MHQIKGSKAKHIGASLTKVLMSCFTTSWRFLDKIRSKVLNCKNGLADRILTLYDQHDSISLDETAQNADNLYQSPIKNLNHFYEQTYTEHHTTDKEDTLRQLAKEAFIAYTKQDEYKNDAKSSKNVSKIATVLHVLWHHIDNLLKLKTDPAPTNISADVMVMAISLSDCFSNFKIIIQAVKNLIYVYCVWS